MSDAIDVLDQTGPTPAIKSTTTVIVYIPGLDEPPSAADAFANRVATALDQESPFEPAKFHVEPPAAAGSPHRIVEVVGPDSRPVVDIHRMEYETEIRQEFEQASRPKRTFLLAVLVIYTGIVHLLPAVVGFRRGKAGMAKAQLIVSLLIFFVLSLYTVILFAAVVNVAVQRVSGTPRVGPLQYLALAFTAVGALIPQKAKAKIAYAAVNYYAASSYLGFGIHRGNEASRLSKLLEDIVESSGDDTSVYVVAYSFGSVIALDALFPPDRARPSRLDRIDGLITIGCPFDLIRTVWPHYFDGDRGGDLPGLWLNVFTPLDVLGSNFIDGNESATVLPAVTKQKLHRQIRWSQIGPVPDPKAAPPAVPIHPENQIYSSGPLGERPGPLQVLTLSGLKAHSMYWDRNDPEDIGCIRQVVSRVLQEEPTLLSRR